MSLAKGSVAEQVSRPLAPAVALRTVFNPGRRVAHASRGASIFHGRAMLGWAAFVPVLEECSTRWRHEAQLPHVSGGRLTGSPG